MSGQKQNLPRYRQVYEILRKHIVNGVYREGDMLPSENELCQTNGITRPTVRLALDQLVKDRFIKKQQGKGSIVCAQPKGIGILSVAGTTTAIGKENLKTKILEGPVIRKWDDPFIFSLSDVEKESGCIYMERVRLVNNKPLFYDITFLPNINLPRFTSRTFENRSLFDILRRSYQVKVTGGEQRLKAIPAIGKICQHLDVKEGDPVLHLERKINTNRIDFSFYSTLFCNTTEHDLFGIF
jgi:GntR family transcriptional regulator/GntR family frlABCD operon transcriptional regulator